MFLKCIKLQNVVHVAEVDVQIRNTRNRVCFSARSVVRSACVCLLELMATSRFALATTTGRPKEEDPNAPEASKFHQWTMCLVLVASLLSFKRKSLNSCLDILECRTTFKCWCLCSSMYLCSYQTETMYLNLIMFVFACFVLLQGIRQNTFCIEFVVKFLARNRYTRHKKDTLCKCVSSGYGNLSRTLFLSIMMENVVS